MRKKKAWKIVLIILSIMVCLASIAGASFYYVKYKDLNKQKVKVEKQLKALPELEKDIFTKCMADKGGTAENIAFCQENTQKQMYTLAQDLTNAKKDLGNKKWYQVIQ